MFWYSAFKAWMLCLGLSPFSILFVAIQFSSDADWGFPVPLSPPFAFDALDKGWEMSGLWVYRFSLHRTCYVTVLMPICYCFCYSSFVTDFEIRHSNTSSYESEILLWLHIIQGGFGHLRSSDFTFLDLGWLLSVYEIWPFSLDQRHSSNLSHFGHSEPLTSLTLQIHEYRLSSHLPLASQFLSSVFYNLQFLENLKHTLNLFLSTLFCWCFLCYWYYLNGIIDFFHS